MLRIASTDSRWATYTSLSLDKDKSSSIRREVLCAVVFSPQRQKEHIAIDVLKRWMRHI